MKLMKLITLLVVISLTPGEIHAQISQSKGWGKFDSMADYLSRGSGKWTGENTKHDPANPRSPRAFGLWFERPLESLLTIQIVAYLGDSTILSSQGIFAWHPVKEHFVHIASDRGNGYSEGISEFPTDSMFVSTMVGHRPNGKISQHKDENFIVSEDVHRNTSYNKDENGNWVKLNDWTWTRDPE